MRPRILYVTWDGDRWDDFSRSYSYTCQLGPVEGLDQLADVVPIVILKTRHDKHLQFHQINLLVNLLKKEKFDVVFFPLCHGDASPHLFNAFQQSSNVRVAVFTESLTERCCLETKPIELIVRRSKEFFTHFVCYDDLDLASFPGHSFFCPTSVPSSCLVSEVQHGLRSPGIAFFGNVRTLTTVRGQELDKLEQAGLLVRPERPEKEFGLAEYEHQMSNLQKVNQLSLEYWSAWSRNLMRIRKDIFNHYLAQLTKYRVILSPHTRFGSYPGRVMEAMASGCAVLSRNPPQDRTKTHALFRKMDQIMTYTDSEDVQYIAMLMQNQDSTELMAKSALDEIRKHHTTETRMRDILHWVGLQD